jgi:hypothetical protein
MGYKLVIKQGDQIVAELKILGDKVYPEKMRPSLDHVREALTAPDGNPAILKIEFAEYIKD